MDAPEKDFEKAKTAVSHGIFVIDCAQVLATAEGDAGLSLQRAQGLIFGAATAAEAGPWSPSMMW